MRLWVLLLLFGVGVSIAGYTKIQDKNSLQREDDDDASVKKAVHAAIKEVVKKKNRGGTRDEDDIVAAEDAEEEEYEDVEERKPLPKKKAKPEKKEEKKKQTKKTRNSEEEGDDTMYYVCDCEDDSACTCEQNEVNCDEVIFEEDKSSLSTLMLVVQDKDFLPLYFYGRNNSITSLKKGQVLPKHEATISTLDLASNRIMHFESGALANFKNLTKLDLSYNLMKTLKSSAFSGAPEEKLQQLKLIHNKFRKFEDGVFENLKNLRRLELDSNNLVDINKELFRGLDKLEVLSLDHCGLKDIPVNAFDYLTNLKELSLRGNPFTEVPRAINALPKLEDLDISETQITEFHEKTLKSDHNVKLIYMENMQYLYAIQDCAFCGLNNLEEVHASNSSKLYRVHPNAFGYVSGEKVTTLKVLDFKFCNLTTLSEKLYDWPDDFTLNLGGNKINCSCETSFLLEEEYFTFEKSNHIPRCGYPTEVAGKPLAAVKQSEVCSEVKSARRGIRFKQCLFFLLCVSFFSFVVYYLVTSGRLSSFFSKAKFTQVSYANLTTKEDEQNLESDFQPRPQEV